MVSVLLKLCSEDLPDALNMNSEYKSVTSCFAIQSFNKWMTAGSLPSIYFFLQVIPLLIGEKEDALYQNYLVLFQY